MRFASIEEGELSRVDEWGLCGQQGVKCIVIIADGSRSLNRISQSTVRRGVGRVLLTGHARVVLAALLLFSSSCTV